MANNNGETLKYRVNELEKDVSGVSADVKKIMTNDLPHIYRETQAISDSISANNHELQGLRKTIWAVGGLIISVIAVAFTIANI